MWGCWHVLKSNLHLLSTPTKSSQMSIHSNLMQRILTLEKYSSYRTVHNTKEEFKEIHKLIHYWQDLFEKQKIIEPKQSIEYIIVHVLGLEKVTDLINVDDKKLTNEQLEKLEQLCECRLSRMPVQYIIGEWDFRYITLKLEPPIFIPRVETEAVVDILLRKIDGSKINKCNILEIGCGSGAISLSLLHSNKHINIVAIDANSRACELTMTNARNLQIENRLLTLNAILKEDGTIEIKNECQNSNQPENFGTDKFEFIVSNPPYIPTQTLYKLQPEIRLYEDFAALDGGDDGLKLIKPILKYASEALNSGGFLILEVHSSHPKKIALLIKENYANKLELKKIHKDFCNIERIVEIVKI